MDVKGLKGITAQRVITSSSSPSALLGIAAMDTEVTTLQKAALERIVAGLGEVSSSIACRFCCGTTLSSPDQVNLVYERRGRNWSSITFPGAEQADVQQLLGVCSIASFGVGGEEVTDRNYRNALKLQPNQFTTSLQLCDTPILDEIRKLMMPDMRGSIRAELYKLNVYSGPGGHFKAHVDTPRSSQMFGSLVVCLPTQFSGGALATRHQGREVRFDWSSSPQKPMQKVSWAAFFSDVEHEVLPVTDGYRLTLTYNLYWDKLQDVTPTANITNSPFYHELCAAVSNPHFLRDGGVLGFSCQHDYVFEDLNSTGNLPCLLKGADNVVYVGAISLGLPVIVKPVLDPLDTFRSEKPYRIVLPNFEEFFVDDSGGVDDDQRDEECMIGDIFGSETHYDKRITWCQEITKLQPAFAFRIFGNEASCAVAYQSAAILVCIPEWGKRQALGTEPQHYSAEEIIEGSRVKSRAEEEEEEREPEEDRAAAFGGEDMNNLLRCDSDDST